MLPIQIEQDESKGLRKPGPERRITNIGGNVGDEQAADQVDDLCDDGLLRKGVDAVTLLPAKGCIHHRPDVLVPLCSQIPDMVIMVIETTASRPNMQVVMAGYAAG
jgi:hypothetical protein